MHKEGEDSLTLALTPFTIVTNSKSPIRVYIHIFTKTVTKIKIHMEIVQELLWGSMGSNVKIVNFYP